MADKLPEYEIYAIRYAWRPALRRDHFLFGDPHEAPMPMDYFVWALKSPERNVVIDTGFTAEVSAKRGRTHLRCPAEALNLIGIDPNKVEDVIQTHVHYDHVGNFEKFPKARFHIQEPEILFAVGRHMKHDMLAHAYEVEDICGVIKLNYAKRVSFYNGPVDFAPGITLHPTGGHTPGFQFVRVHTKRGWVVMASDATHFYENIEEGRPFPAITSLPDVFEAYEQVKAASPSPDHMIPGHDPLVMELYPAPSPELKGIVVRLDVPPNKSRKK